MHPNGANVVECIMKRNMLAMAIFMCLGIFSWNNYRISTIIAVAILLTGYCIWCCVKEKYVQAAVAIFSVCIGFALIHNAYSEKMATGKYFDGREIVICGKVINSEQGDDYSRFEVKHRYTDENGKNKTVKIRTYYDGGKYSVRYGDIVEFSAKTYIPDMGGGFGDYNSRTSYFSEGIVLCANADNGIQVTKNEPDFRNLFDLAYVIREAICSKIHNCFDGDVAGICEGLIVGQKDDISQEVTETFRKSGISHIIVVSGMHVNIIVWILTAVMSLFGIGKQRFTAIFYILGIWLFVLIAGIDPSACRAAIVATVLYIGMIFKKDADSYNSLGLAVVIMFIVNPLIYFNIGFRLSVLSVLGILIFSGKIKEKVKFLPRVFADAFAVTVSAQICLIPILAQTFGYIGFIGIAVNIIVCPVITLLVSLIIAALIFSGVPVIGSFLLWIVNILISGIIQITKWIAMMPYVSFKTYALSGGFLIIYGLMVLALYYFLVSNKKSAKKVTLVALSLLLILVSENTFSDKTQITFLSTGNSDCSILESDKRVFMFDGAGDFYKNTAENDIIPYLEKQGIEKVDVAFVTHYHLDHAKGIQELISADKIKNIVIPVGIYKNSFEIVNVAKEKKIKIYSMADSDKICFDNLNIEAYNTFDGKEQNNGMVYFVSYGESRVCIAGDVHKDGEKRIIERKIKLKSNILKVPHHGSDTSGSEEFYKRVSPEYAIVTTGENTHPEDEGALLCRKLGIKRYTTNDCGSIRIRFQKGGKSSIYFGRNNLYELRDIKKTG